MDAVTLHHGDALDVLRGMADNSVDAVVTDPPSGIGFMGKTWDHDHGGREGWVKAFAAIFAECLRVVKPGGHAFVWALPRTSHWTACALEDAGWEVRDCVAHLFGSGFPKSYNVAKGIEGKVRTGSANWSDWKELGGEAYPSKPGYVRLQAEQGYRGDYSDREARDVDLTTPEAQAWRGWGTALKPAIEFWWLARKPLVGTVAANVQQWGTGALNIEACRVGTAKNVPASVSRKAPANCYGKFAERGETPGVGGHDPNLGRWPPNVAISHAPGCERVGTRRVKADKGGEAPAAATWGTYGTTPGRHYADADGLEAVEEWACVDGCAVKALAEQSGERKAAGHYNGEVTAARHGFIGGNTDAGWGYGDTGTAARFFPNFEASPLDDVTPFLYTAKASRREREAGLEGMEGKPQGQRYGTVQDARPHTRDGYEYPRQPMRNTHPTVKSLALMRWLCRLVTPPGGVVLDCFLGSGTTGMAATMEGFRFIGVEQDAEYIEIARRRIAWAQEQQPPLLRATGD